MAGLMPQTLRLDQDEEQPVMPEGATVIIEGDPKGDLPEFDDKGNVIRIDHEDGSITVSLDGQPVQRANDNGALGWFDNLVEKIETNALRTIVDELLTGVEEDKQSRTDWMETRAQGIKLLGITVDLPNVQGTADGAPVEGMSRVRHPLLLEACLRFQANAMAELLPVDGPVKVKNFSGVTPTTEDDLADNLESDMNKFLTTVATEYYADTDRMFFMLGFGGCTFKKVYFCPLRNRPVSETVDAEYLIVSNDATDLENAPRITHEIEMQQSVVRRMQLLGAYRDIELGSPTPKQTSPVEEEKQSQQGVRQETVSTENLPRTIYEIYCELDIPGFEFEWKGKASGLKVPYRVTVDVSSRECLSIVRNYKEPEKGELPKAKQVFVKYSFVPAMGFYDIGLLHILGNTTNALTAAWRELLDAGMFASFPGFLVSRAAARQQTSIMRVPPGGAVQIETGGQPIGNAVMPLPYKEPSGTLATLSENMAQTGARIGGTAEIMVGEGRQDAPVGTTIAMIEQATKTLNSVHKRMHRSQSVEFQILRELFLEHPESFTGNRKWFQYQWNEENFAKALENFDLVPQADPNTASHIQRVMKVMGLKQLQAGNPNGFDPVAVDTEALKALGWSNPEQFMVPPSNQPNPADQQKLAQAQAQGTMAQARMLDAQTKAKEVNAKMQSGAFAPGGMTPEELALKQQDAKIKQTQIDFQQNRASVEDENRDKDRQAELLESQRRFQMEQMQLQNDREQRDMDRMNDRHQQAMDHAVDLHKHHNPIGLAGPSK